MSNSDTPFRRGANPTAMIFRLSFVYGMYVILAWFILRDFSSDALPRMLSILFAGFILLAVFQIRLRNRINGRTDTLVGDAAVMYPDAGTKKDGEADVEVVQSFDAVSYRKMNLEVMFTYLRPWLTALNGLVFLGVTITAAVTGQDTIRVVLSVMLTFYFLAIPWIMFFPRVRKAFRKGAEVLAEQRVTVSPDSISVAAGGATRDITALTDIAVTRNYLLLYIAGSNYIQIRRSSCPEGGEMLILARAAGMVDPA